MASLAQASTTAGSSRKEMATRLGVLNNMDAAEYVLIRIFLSTFDDVRSDSSFSVPALVCRARSDKFVSGTGTWCLVLRSSALQWKHFYAKHGVVIVSDSEELDRGLQGPADDNPAISLHAN
jgi:hypothetical protein